MNKLFLSLTTVLLCTALTQNCLAGKKPNYMKDYCYGYSSVSNSREEESGCSWISKKWNNLDTWKKAIGATAAIIGVGTVASISVLGTLCATSSLAICAAKGLQTTTPSPPFSETPSPILEQTAILDNLDWAEKALTEGQKKFGQYSSQETKNTFDHYFENNGQQYSFPENNPLEISDKTRWIHRSTHELHTFVQNAGGSLWVWCNESPYHVSSEMALLYAINGCQDTSKPKHSSNGYGENINTATQEETRPSDNKPEEAHITCAKTLAQQRNYSLKTTEKLARGIQNSIHTPKAACHTGQETNDLLKTCFKTECSGVEIPSENLAKLTRAATKEGTMHPDTWAIRLLPILEKSTPQQLRDFCTTPAGHAAVEAFTRTKWEQTSLTMKPLPSTKKGPGLRIHLSQIPSQYEADFKEGVQRLENIIIGGKGLKPSFTNNIKVDIKGPLWPAGPARGGVSERFSNSNIARKGSVSIEASYLELDHRDTLADHNMLVSLVVHEVGHAISQSANTNLIQKDAQGHPLITKDAEGNDAYTFIGPKATAYYKKLLRHAGKSTDVQGVPYSPSGHPHRLGKIEGAYNVMNNAWDGAYVTPLLLQMWEDLGYAIDWNKAREYFPPNLINLL